MTSFNRKTEVKLKYVNNKVAAEMLGVTVKTLQWHTSVNGCYLGMTPTKLPNGRVMWEKENIESLLRVEK